MAYMDDLGNKVATEIGKKFVAGEGNIDQNAIKEVVAQNDTQKKLDENKIQQITNEITTNVNQKKTEFENKIDDANNIIGNIYDFFPKLLKFAEELALQIKASIDRLK